MADGPGQHNEDGTAHPLDPLVDLMATLRGESGCPWDRAQTHTSLKPYLIEEACEVLDAIDGGNPAELCEELGDVLLQVVFHARLAEERGEFTIDDVVRRVTEKMIRRHPHVFGDARAESVEAVLAQWDDLKARERSSQGAPSRPDDPPAAGLPALILAEQAQERGFCLRPGEQIPHPRAAVERALAQLDAAGDASATQAAWGELLWSLVAWGRTRGLVSEVALRETVWRAVRASQTKAGPSS
ncbi:MAG TPA: MazG family protein [Limnochordia bacterium]